MKNLTIKELFFIFNSESTNTDLQAVLNKREASLSFIDNYKFHNNGAWDDVKEKQIKDKQKQDMNLVYDRYQEIFNHYGNIRKLGQVMIKNSNFRNDINDYDSKQIIQSYLFDDERVVDANIIYSSNNVNGPFIINGDKDVC